MTRRGATSVVVRKTGFSSSFLNSMFKYSISVYKIYLFPPTIFLTIKAMIFFTCCIRTQPLATWLEVFLPRSPVTSLLQNSMRIFGFYLIWPLCCIWHHDHSILFRNTFFSWIFKSSVLVLPNSRRSFQAYFERSSFANLLHVDMKLLSIYWYLLSGSLLDILKCPTDSP